MQYFSKNFDPREYDSLTDLSGNKKSTLMIHNKTRKLIVRKTISGINIELYKQLIHIRHENLVQLMGLEETETNCYTYEEYINGETLAEVLSKGPIPEEKAVKWIGQLCEAVRILHDQKPIIIHRDIKPGNIMLFSDGAIKLIDFDASKAFTPNQQSDTELVGTPNYAAPEQYGFSQSDPRTDIYAIGILFHELITGYKPNEIRTLYKGRYKYIIRNCIELDPRRRYRSVKELENQLRKYGLKGFIENVPGFRTGVRWKNAVASVVYVVSVITLIACFCSEWVLSENILESLSFPGLLIIFFVPPYILITNFLKLRDRLPLLRSRFISVKIGGIVIYFLSWLLLVIVYLMMVVTYFPV